MLTNIGLAIVLFILVLTIVRFLYFKYHTPQQPVYIRKSGQNGKKFHEWKNL